MRDIPRMGASVHIPEPQYGRLKARAEREGTTVRTVVLRSIEKELSAETPKPASCDPGKQTKQSRFPASRSKTPRSLRPGEEGVYGHIPFP